MTQLEFDKMKLELFRSDLRNLKRPEVKSIEAAVIKSIVDGKLAEIDKYIETELNKL